MEDRDRIRQERRAYMLEVAARARARRLELMEDLERLHEKEVASGRQDAGSDAPEDDLPLPPEAGGGVPGPDRS